MYCTRLTAAGASNQHRPDQDLIHLHLFYPGGPANEAAAPRPQTCKLQRPRSLRRLAAGPRLASCNCRLYLSLPLGAPHPPRQRIVQRQKAQARTPTNSVDRPPQLLDQTRPNLQPAAARSSRRDRRPAQHVDNPRQGHSGLVRAADISYSITTNTELLAPQTVAQGPRSPPSASPRAPPLQQPHPPRLALLPRAVCYLVTIPAVASCCSVLDRLGALLAAAGSPHCSQSGLSPLPGAIRQPLTGRTRIPGRLAPDERSASSSAPACGLAAPAAAGWH